MSDDWKELSPADLAYRWREKSVTEYVDDAVGDGWPGEEYETAVSALGWLRDSAWHDLQRARERAHDGKWSIECGYQLSRIVGLTSLVGPASWEVVPVDLILDGVYERIHERIGKPTPLSDADRARAREVYEKRFHW
jgi:hypothetical protein